MAAYNEENNLPAIFEDIKKQNWNFKYTVLLVNDGSTDNTRNIASEYSKQLPVTIIDHERNKGLGSALKTGFTYLNSIVGLDDIVVVLDADNSHPVDVIASMISKINSGSDLVIASRYCAGGGQRGVSGVRRFLSFGAGLFLTLIWPIKNVKDFSNGFRMYRGSLIKAIFERFKDKFIEETGFAASIEILLKASLVTDKVTETPLILRYDNKKSSSKLKIFYTIFRYIMLVGHLRTRL
jgi:dolichol-phosphate mannosyltransferase